MALQYPKKPPIRLKGKQLQNLYRAVWERDDWTCQGGGCPGTYPLDSKPHHVRYRSQAGSDTMDNLVTLCIYCHGKAHGVNRI
jgi:5-methylcytosine-specific restriction endonuclease McrA